MESKIEFKGCKYAVEGVNGFVMQFNSEPKITLNGISIDDEMFSHDIWTLHTNPDHKESKEMKSDRLADEIMEKGKEAVYTREMFDNGEAPKIGMMFICKEKTFNSRISDFLNKVVEVIGVSILNGDEVITFSHEIMGIGCGRFGEEWVKPIDTRTDSEKAINDIDLSITDTNNSLTGTYKLERNFSTESIALLQKIKAGEIHGVSFTGDKK
jgi:hypothetical protein